MEFNITFFILFLYLNVGQDPISKVAFIKIPKNIQKISNESAVSFIQKKYNKPRMNSGLKNIYKSKNMIIGFEDYVRSSLMDLDELKERILGNMEEIRSAGTNDKVDIIIIKGKRFLIHKRHKNDEYVFSFISELNNDNKGLTGGILFKKVDSAKANTTLENLLRNIVFK